MQQPLVSPSENYTDFLYSGTTKERQNNSAVASVATPSGQTQQSQKQNHQMSIPIISTQNTQPSRQSKPR
jgi:hypothetical protein